MRVTWNRERQTMREDVGSLGAWRPGPQEPPELDLPGGSARSAEATSPAPAPSERAQSVPQPGESPEPLPRGGGQSEALLRQEESMLAEAYRRFLEEIRQERSLETPVPASHALGPLPAEETFEGLDLGLSSFRWIRRSEGSTQDPTEGSGDA
jgi:hypothetical protein